ncbi:hypothetical protein CK203_044736 [Vitis vinifera]|uniref:Uncharacterized protein n=1 Tax=Vitis vinifera TaxID=29760 RepID=A0A438H9D0_VITVI|nr:hypothetical protein CK203_064350 [Vitis vinifera]RVW81144.1 hypothetical protein CK203_044736 [Vitis vinifera]
MSHFAGIDHFSEHLTQEMTALRAHQEQIIATQTQHTAILRQIQHHLGIPSAPEHQMPAPLEPTEPTAGDTETSTEPLSSHHHPPSI